ncbi:MAG: hypothetical protein LBI84_07560 [Propionibacteriaceae bacterium]|nr:hypothetical protein [Propionibacteriaceae bacterium]
MRKQTTELTDCERAAPHPLASRKPGSDPDDGVLANHRRFGKAVLRIKAIKDKGKTVEGRTWPCHRPKPEDGV